VAGLRRVFVEFRCPVRTQDGRVITEAQGETEIELPAGGGSVDLDFTTSWLGTKWSEAFTIEYSADLKDRATVRIRHPLDLEADHVELVSDGKREVWRASWGNGATAKAPIVNVFPAGEKRPTRARTRKGADGQTVIDYEYDERAAAVIDDV